MLVFEEWTMTQNMINIWYVGIGDILMVIVNFVMAGSKKTEISSSVNK